MRGIKKAAYLGSLCAERQNRTVDTTIFSRVLYQLSYLGSSTLADVR